MHNVVLQGFIHAMQVMQFVTIKVGVNEMVMITHANVTIPTSVHIVRLWAVMRVMSKEMQFVTTMVNVSKMEMNSFVNVTMDSVEQIVKHMVRRELQT